MSNRCATEEQALAYIEENVDVVGPHWIWRRGWRKDQAFMWFQGHRITVRRWLYLRAGGSPSRKAWRACEHPYCVKCSVAGHVYSRPQNKKRVKRVNGSSKTCMRCDKPRTDGWFCGRECKRATRAHKPVYQTFFGETAL